MPVITPVYNNVIGPSWLGFDDIEFLFIFGDSYSAVGAPKEPTPSKDEPLGIAYPGMTYNEPDEPNWVGCLVANYHPMLVYDYALGGHTVEPGVRSQIQQRFLPSAGRRPNWAPWNASNSLFITWVGINDVANLMLADEGDLRRYQKTLFDLQHELYEAGARNFLFIDVPPMEHSPAYRLRGMAKKRELLPFTRWNTALETNVDQFVTSHPGVTALVFSAFDTFSRVFDNPAEYDFNPSEIYNMGGPVWFDHLHPSGAMHAIIAREIGDFLSSQTPTLSSQAQSTLGGLSPPSLIIQTGRYWQGLSALEHLIIFGASYCAVGYDRSSPHPTPEEPLGVPFPGTTWAESGKPNWVGHLVNKLQRRQIDTLVYNFACGGDTVDGVERQIEREFMPELAERPSWAPWESSNTLFTVWVGINDCAFITVDEVHGRVQMLFGLMDRVYDTGARNFLFVNLPPMDRSPGGKHLAANRQRNEKCTFDEWNDILPKAARQLSDRHPDATILVYSSYETFTRVLDNPTQSGFGVEDVSKQGGSIWYDRIHPSSKMHNEIANDLLEFLSSIASSLAL